MSGFQNADSGDWKLPPSCCSSQLCPVFIQHESRGAEMSVLGEGPALKSSDCQQHCRAVIMNRFVFVTFTFPMLPLPFPLSGSCLLLLLLLTYMLSPCGDTHFHGQQQWKPMSAQSSPGSSLLLPPAPHFHYSSKGFLSSHG